MERITPGATAEEWDLHLHRYKVAAQFTRDDDVVVDAACGIGYGREILSGKWIGVDKEPGKGIIQADLLTWKPDFDFDVFVGLETIEHLEHIVAYVTAAKRAARTIVISTPIIPTVHFNQFHVRDFTKDEVEELFAPWEILHYEGQIDPNLGSEVYGIWAFGHP